MAMFIDVFMFNWYVYNRHMLPEFAHYISYIYIVDCAKPLSNSVTVRFSMESPDWQGNNCTHCIQGMVLPMSH